METRLVSRFLVEVNVVEELYFFHTLSRLSSAAFPQPEVLCSLCMFISSLLDLSVRLHFAENEIIDYIKHRDGLLGHEIDMIRLLVSYLFLSCLVLSIDGLQLIPCGQVG